jgi:hypothetical protein
MKRISRGICKKCIYNWLHNQYPWLTQNTFEEVYKCSILRTKIICWNIPRMTLHQSRVYYQSTRRYHGKKNILPFTIHYHGTAIIEDNLKYVPSNCPYILEHTVL